MSAVDVKAKAKAKTLANPVTGQQPNSFTQVTNHTLATPTSPRASTLDPTEGRRLRAQTQQELASPTSRVDAPLGYRAPDGMSHRSFSWLMGAHHMFPNTSTGPAINEPHAAEAGIKPLRRAEDLSGPEYNQGRQALAHYGHDVKDPVGSLRSVQERNVRRVVAEHVAAGTEESASQLFYGGTPQTKLPEPFAEAHRQSMMGAQERMREARTTLQTDPHFQTATAGASEEDKHLLARNVTASNVSDTSPNSKFRTSKGWPNIEQAEEAGKAGLEGRKPTFISGRIQNNDKAAARTADAVRNQDPAVDKFGDPKSAPKTIAFRNALIRHDSPDSYAVSDVMEGHQVFPGMTTSKGLNHREKSTDGTPTGPMVAVHPDTPRSARKNLVPVLKPGAKGPVADTGLSRVEEGLRDGKSYVHAINDHVHRQISADMGISRGENYADNVNALQAAKWGSEQVSRPDVNVSHADQYPVVRDWAAEGHDNLTGLGRQMFGSRSGMGQQFRVNPNTKARGAGKDPMRGPGGYPIKPGA